MSDAKRQATAFNPKSTALRRKLWVRMETPGGPRIFFIWSRIFKLLAVLLVLGWLGSATALWAFVRYQRGVSTVSLVDIAFLPLRRAEYRATLGRHHFETAKQQLGQQRWGEAIFNLRAAVSRTPGNLEARRILASIYHQSRQPEPAMKLLEDGLVHARTDLPYLRETFGLLQQQRQPERILRQADRFLPAAPDREPHHLFIALQAAAALHALQRDEEALALIKRWTLERHAEGQNLIAAIAIASGRFQQAERIYRDQLQQNPQNEAAALHLTRLFIRQGRTEDARRAALLRSLAIPHSAGAGIDLISLTWQTGAKEQFQREAQAFLAQHKGDTRALQMLASLASDLAQPGLAATTLATAQAAGHAPAPFQFSLLLAQCNAGDFAAAVTTAEALPGNDELPPPVGRRPELSQGLGPLRPQPADGGRGLAAARPAATAAADRPVAQVCRRL
jgi:thioredoxin-like negative regulator of GroEL